MSANLPCSSLGFKSCTVVGRLANGFGVPGVEDGGGWSRASEMNVCATSNCPSRSRCIAIARFMREGCEARASYSVGRFLTGSVYDTLVFAR